MTNSISIQYCLAQVLFLTPGYCLYNTKMRYTRSNIMYLFATISSCRKMWHVFCWRQCFRHNWKFSKYYSSILSSFSFSKVWPWVALVYCHWDCWSTTFRGLWTRSAKMNSLGSVLLLMPLAVGLMVIAENSKDVGLGWEGMRRRLCGEASAPCCPLLGVHQHKCAELALVCTWELALLEAGALRSTETHKCMNCAVLYSIWFLNFPLYRMF